MKPLTLLSMVGGACVSLLALCTLGQSANQPYIEISGKHLTLGMTMGEVTDRLAGSTVTKMSDDFWGIGANQPPAETVQFTKGRLTFAQRYWTSTSNDIFDSLFGAVTTLNNQGFSSCHVTTGTNIQPEMSTRVIWIVCGAKSISITRDTINQKSYNLVHEELGDYRKD
jgi:hypothetical protein